MLRTKKKQLNLKPNRQLDKRSSRGMLYENEELRLRTIHINDEVDKGHTDIKKLRKENEYLKREIWSLRDECSKLEDVLKKVYSGNPPPLSELPTYQPRVRKQSTFSGVWGGGRRGSNMSFSNCSSYDYEIDNDNENDPDYDPDDDPGLGLGLGLEQHKKISRQNSSLQDTISDGGNGSTHVNWEDQQQQLEVYLTPEGPDSSESQSNNTDDSQDYCLNQQIVLSHPPHHNHNPWQMHLPDLEAVTEESENASNSNNSNNNSNPTSQVLQIPIQADNSNPNSISNSNASINNVGLPLHNGFLYLDNERDQDSESGLFEALELESQSMNCSMERININTDQSQNQNQNQDQNQQNFSAGLSVERPVSVSSFLNSNNNNSYFRPIIEITPARSSPTSTIASGIGGGKHHHFQEDLRERPNSSASAVSDGGSGSGSIIGPSSSPINISQMPNSDLLEHDLYHDLGCVTEIPKKYQVTSELKITVSRSSSPNSNSVVDQIILPDSPDHDPAPHFNPDSADSDKKIDASSSSSANLRFQQQSVKKPTSFPTSFHSSDDSSHLSQVHQLSVQNQNNTSNSNLESTLTSKATANVTTKPAASYRVLKIYSTYLSKTHRRPSASGNSSNNTSLSQSEPNLNCQDIFQFPFQSHSQRHCPSGAYDDICTTDGGEVGHSQSDSGWSPRPGQLTCRKLQGWSRSCCHTSTLCQCHSNSRTSLNPFEMCSCNCASENPHINLKDDWNVFDRNIVIGLLDEEPVTQSQNKDRNSTVVPGFRSFRYLSVQEVIDELEGQFDPTLESTHGVRLFTLPDFNPCRVFISLRAAVSVKALIERGLTLRGHRIRLIDASQNAFSFIILSGLPPSFPDSSIISVLNEFGQVVAPLQRRAYKGVDTSERMARMHLVRIPPTSQIPLNIAGFEVLAKFVSQPSHEIPMAQSSVLSTANDMISTHAVLTCTTTASSNSNPSNAAPTVTANVNSLPKSASVNPSLPTSADAACNPNPNLKRDPLTLNSRASASASAMVPVPASGNKSPVITTIPRPHKPVTRSTTLDSALGASASGQNQTQQQQHSFQPTTPTTATSRFGLGPTATAISKRNMSICGSLLDCQANVENSNGQKGMLLGNPKKPLSRLPRSSPGSLIPPSPGVGGPGSPGVFLGDNNGLTAGQGAGNNRPLSRSMSFEPRRASGNGKALAVGSQLSLVESQKLHQGSSNNFGPLSDSIGSSGNMLSRQQSRIFQQHRKLSQASSAHFPSSLDKKEELPWCGCWGNGCI